MKRQVLLVIAAAVILSLGAWILTGCGSSSSTGTGSIEILLVDAPLEADEINIEIASVQVHKSGGGWITVREYDTPLEVNLLDYRSGADPLLLADCPLQAGHYTMVRLMLSGAEIVRDGQAYPVNLQNVAQTGVKCNGQFTVESGQLMAIILDFNADRSFINNPPGSDNYMLIPVMTMSPVNIAAEVVGKVTFGTDDSVPPDAIVNVYPQGKAGQEDYLVASAAADADGSFRFAVLAQGTYDFQFLYDFDGPEGVTTIVETVENLVITAPFTDLGTISIPPP